MCLVISYRLEMSKHLCQMHQHSQFGSPLDLVFSYDLQYMTSFFSLTTINLLQLFHSRIHRPYLAKKPCIIIGFFKIFFIKLTQLRHPKNLSSYNETNYPFCQISFAYAKNAANDFFPKRDSETKSRANIIHTKRNTKRNRFHKIFDIN